MLNITRLAHVTLSTSDFGSQEDYYCRGLGLRVLEREKTRISFATMFGLPAVSLEAGSGDIAGPGWNSD
jgi:catechol 2,3-dioxygenase-like lactoylglutathione lyase family enzyme